MPPLGMRLPVLKGRGFRPARVVGSTEERHCVGRTGTVSYTCRRRPVHPPLVSVVMRLLVLVGKDGQIKLRKPFPWDVRELSNSIDKTPLRQQEIRDAQGERSQGVVPE